MTRRTTQLGISFPNEIVQRIEKERQDVPRSRYIKRMIEFYYKNNDDNKTREIS
jgi:metal-responsive CopG/Arc/MetJ family transcriptional regulator